MEIKEDILTLLTDGVKACKNAGDYRIMTDELRALFLQYWSETSNNVETSKYLALGSVKNPDIKKNESGLILESQQDLLSNIIWHTFGNAEIPEEIKQT